MTFPFLSDDSFPKAKLVTVLSSSSSRRKSQLDKGGRVVQIEEIKNVIKGEVYKLNLTIMSLAILENQTMGIIILFRAVYVFSHLFFPDIPGNSLQSDTHFMG